MLADGIKDCDEFYGSTNPRTGNFTVMGWLAGVDMFCEEQRFTQELPSQFASNRSGDQHTEWSVEKLPFYVRNLGGVPNPYMVPIFKSSHDVEVPFNLWISAIPDLSVFINTKRCSRLTTSTTSRSLRAQGAKLVDSLFFSLMTACGRLGIVFMRRWTCS